MKLRANANRNDDRRQISTGTFVARKKNRHSSQAFGGHGLKSAHIESVQSEIATSPLMVAQRRQIDQISPSSEAQRVDGAPEAQRNRTGLPDDLKQGVESLSGLDMGDVRVHYNSSKPERLHALAYTQGADIHVGPGQEKHLPHETWHVVQQKEGRVGPTIETGRVSINDDSSLEHEAESMGARALHTNPNEGAPVRGRESFRRRPASMQMVWKTGEGGSFYNDETGALYNSNDRVYSGPIKTGWANKRALKPGEHDALMKKIHADLEPQGTVAVDPEVTNALSDSSGVSIAGDGIEVHLDVDQLKHQHHSQPIGTREKGGGTKFNPEKYGSTDWHQRNTMVYMRDWARDLRMKDGEKKYHGQAENVDGIHYEGYCLNKGGTKYVLFHCYPDKDSKYKL